MGSALSPAYFVFHNRDEEREACYLLFITQPLLLPLDETQRRTPYYNSSMEPVDTSAEMALLSNILAAYSFITVILSGKESESDVFGHFRYPHSIPGRRQYYYPDITGGRLRLLAYLVPLKNPERAALYFVSGICVGLLLTLFALVLRVSCQTDCKRSPTKKPLRDCNSNSSESDDDSDTTSDISARRHRRFERTLNMNVFTSAEEIERAQRLEERERIIREIWMNGQPDIPGTRTLNRYY